MKNIIPFTTPILLIAFNRYENTLEVFKKIREIKPTRFYFAVDGPRTGKAEEVLVEQVKGIIKQVDWECEIKTLFRDKNVGCGRGPSEAITWAFENEEHLIVLEDDCVPSLSFFTFCDDMLEKYKDDKRVNIISGRSHQSGTKFFEQQDYIFTHFAHTWGWATWKRVWDEFDIYMKDLPNWLRQGGAHNVHLFEEAANNSNKHLLQVYKKIEKEVTHSWDTQWSYTRLKTGGLGIVPCKNLIHNIGNDGTHSNHQNIDMPAEEMPTIIRHPQFVVANKEYEIYHYNNHIKRSHIIKRVISKIKRMLTQ